jgi:hypothetical protein
MCEALLGIKHDGDTNPFLTDDDKSDADGRIWGDLARAALARLDLEPTRGASVAPDETDEFIALKDWIARRFHPRRVHSNEFTERELLELQASFYFQKIEEDFGLTVGWVCEKVYHGIPLYEQSPTGSYLPIPFNHEDCIYLSKKGEHLDWRPESSYPYWAKRYFLKQQHLVVYDIFYGGADKSPDAETVNVLRASFRREIGFSAEDATMTKIPKVKSARYVKSALRPVIDLWPKVAEITGLRGIHAVVFVEQTFDRLKLSLYMDDEVTGLYSALDDPDKAHELLGELGVSDYAQGFFNGAASEPGGWANWCMTPQDFETVIREARDLTQATPESKSLQPNNSEPSSVAASGNRPLQVSTSLSRIVGQILNGQCAEFLQLKSEGEAWPKQEVVVPWLQRSDTFGLSEAEAKAVDAVTRPDALRARGKRSKVLRPG